MLGIALLDIVLFLGQFSVCDISLLFCIEEKGLSRSPMLLLDDCSELYNGQSRRYRSRGRREALARDLDFIFYVIVHSAIDKNTHERVMRFWPFFSPSFVVRKILEPPRRNPMKDLSTRKRYTGSRPWFSFGSCDTFCQKRVLIRVVSGTVQAKHTTQSSNRTDDQYCTSRLSIIIISR